MRSLHQPNVAPTSARGIRNATATLSFQITSPVSMFQSRTTSFVACAIIW